MVEEKVAGPSFSWDENDPPSMQAKERLRWMLTYLDHPTLQELLLYIDHKGPVSLRILEWCVTNYSKIHARHLHEKYISFRNLWKRHLFDCFARFTKPKASSRAARSVIIYLHYDGQKHRTTVAQLHYLLWAKKNGVLEYCVAHEKEIEAHMIETMTQSQEVKRVAKMVGLKKKRSTLTHIAVQNSCVFYDVETTVSLSV